MLLNSQGRFPKGGYRIVNVGSFEICRSLNFSTSIMPDFNIDGTPITVVFCLLSYGKKVLTAGVIFPIREALNSFSYRVTIGVLFVADIKGNSHV